MITDSASVSRRARSCRIVDGVGSMLWKVQRDVTLNTADLIFGSASGTRERARLRWAVTGWAAIAFLEN